MHSDKIYILNYSKLVNWLTPNRIKNAGVINWTYSLVYPFVLLYNSFKVFRKAKIYQLLITPQTCYLERLLNDRFDYTLRRIYIIDSKDKAPFYIYKTAELKPKYLHRHVEHEPKYIYTEGESGAIKDDFIVMVPVSVVFDIAEMTSLLKAYKLAGTKFKIQTFA